jgi:hypothetical protein
LESPIFVVVLRCTEPEAPHTISLEAFDDRFNAVRGVLPYVTRDERTQEVARYPMTHLQAAVFVGGLKEVTVDSEDACARVYGDVGDLELWAERHEDGEELVAVPCCGEKWAKGCLRKYLMECKAVCNARWEGWL